ncbi:MAG TPA: tetratricopeptide repeat protein [Planctomycetota bacterium]
MRRLLLLAAVVGLSSCSSTATQDQARLEEYYARSLRYYDAGDLARAEQQARMGLAIEPDDGRLNHLLGRTLLRWHDLRSVGRSRGFLEKAHEELDTYKTAYSLAEFHLRYAQFLIGETEVLTERAAELDPEEVVAGDFDSRIQNQRLKSAEHLVEAHGLLERTLAEATDDVFALRLMANVQTHQGQDRAALATLDRLVQVLVDSRQFKNKRLARFELPVAEETVLRRDLMDDIDMEVEARGLSSTVLKRLRDFPAAAEQIDQVLKLKPELAHEYYNRGMCRYWSGNLVAAASDMEIFLRKTTREQESPEVAQALEILNENASRSGRSPNSPAR